MGRVAAKSRRTTADLLRPRADGRDVALDELALAPPTSLAPACSRTQPVSSRPSLTASPRPAVPAPASRARLGALSASRIAIASLRSTRCSPFSPGPGPAPPRAAMLAASRVLRALPPTIAYTLRTLPAPEVEVTVRGWVAHVQPKKRFSFVKLTDGSAPALQVFVAGGKDDPDSLRRCVPRPSRMMCLARRLPSHELTSLETASSTSSRAGPRSPSRARSSRRQARARRTSSRRRP